MSDITIKLSDKEAEALVGLLGEFPTKSNVWPLMMKVSAQVTEQTKAEEGEKEE